MKVWVVISDCGLSGPWIHAMRSTEPTETSEELMHRYADNPPHSNGGTSGRLPGHVRRRVRGGRRLIGRNE